MRSSIRTLSPREAKANPVAELTRRSILRLALGGSLGAGLAACSRTNQPSRVSPRPDAASRHRVAVIGAGLAGLTAAIALRDRGWDVVVLEARTRVGGRVHTLHNPFDPGLHAEAGGESIDDNHDQIQALLRRFGLATERRPTNKILDGVVFYGGQRSRTSEFVQRRSGAVAADYTRFFDSVIRLSANVDPDHPEQASNASSLDHLTLEDFIDGQHLVPEAEFLVRTYFRGNYNAEPRDVSMLFVAQQTVVTANVPDSAAETMRVAGGNSQLTEAMRSDLGERIILGAPVERVEHTGDSVRVHAGQRRVDAAWLIVAAPMNPMRKVRFDPPLPPSLADTIAGLDLGHAAKVITEYPNRFWAGEGFSGFTVCDLPLQVAWPPTDSYASTAGLVTAFTTGAGAARLGALAPSDRLAETVRELGRIYPEAGAAVPGRATSVVWAAEPYTGGGYAVFRPGQMAPFWPALRQGFGRIRFAGEHTETLAGYMESAVRSGHRIATALGTPPN